MGEELSFVWRLSTCCFSPVNSEKNGKPLVLEGNIPPYICYKTHLSKQQGFLGCLQLLKLELNGALPMVGSTKTRGYRIKDLRITTIRILRWLVVLWVFSPWSSLLY